jgi:hypothetical protein
LFDIAWTAASVDFAKQIDLSRMAQSPSLATTTGGGCDQLETTTFCGSIAARQCHSTCPLSSPKKWWVQTEDHAILKGATMVAEVFAVIAHIRSRPEMYFLDPSSEKLDLFLSGWVCGSKDVHSGRTLRAFTVWLKSKLEMTLSFSWSRIAAYETFTANQSFTYALEELRLFEEEVRSGKVVVDTE